MPLRRSRVGRRGVVRAPVAKTAVVAAAVTPGPAPVAKTAVVAAAVINGITDHSAHHRGALAVYARLLGKEPAMPYA